MLVIDEATCRRLLTMNDAIEAVAESFRAISSSGTVAIRSDVNDPQRSVRGLLLGTYSGALHGVCFKVVGSWRGNRGGAIMVFDAATGEVETVIPSAHITDVRTGAASGAAARELAVRSASKLAIIGTGRQATMQLEAMLAVRPIESVALWNRTEATAESWIQATRARLGSGGPNLRRMRTVQDACQDADIVVVATRAAQPVLHGEWLKPGCHVNGVGASTPEMWELSPSVLRRAGVVALDSRELALNTGDMIRALEAGALESDEVGEIGEVLNGERGGRTSEQEITLFKSVGHAANDLSVARMLAAKARATGEGIEVKL